MSTVSIEQFHIELQRNIDAELHSRTLKAIMYLLQQMEIAYNDAFKGKSGSAGAASSLAAEVSRSGRYLEATLGISKADKGYLTYLEYGERGTESAGKGFVDVGSNTRSKGPRVINILKWLRKASISIPDYFKKKAARMAEIRAREHKPKKFDPSKPWFSDDPNVQFAFAISQKLKRKGRPALRIIERTVNSQAARITAYLEGSA